jgi:hypothetical protein
MAQLSPLRSRVPGVVHDDEHEDEHLVADLGVSSVERLVALCNLRLIRFWFFG